MCPEERRSQHPASPIAVCRFGERTATAGAAAVALAVFLATGRGRPREHLLQLMGLGLARAALALSIAGGTDQGQVGRERGELVRRDDGGPHLSAAGGANKA